MLSLASKGTKKIKDFVNNNNTLYNSQKATKFATKKERNIIIPNQ